MTWYDEEGMDHFDEEAKSYKEDGTLTPYGLAAWADEEGGWEGLLDSHGDGPFLEAGVDRDILLSYTQARDRMEAELERIGAML